METIDWWLRPLAWLFERRPDWRDSFGRFLLRVGNHFYLFLALVLAIAGAWDQFVSPLDKQFSNASFDWLMRHRPVAYKADPDIVILDIDEASLAELGKEYGRWPWPRQVLADVAAKAETAGARAILFDISFADKDLMNLPSEVAFDRYVAASRNSFFVASRLNPKNDTQSDVTLSMLNFAGPDPQTPPRKLDGQRTIALLPPYFKSIYDSTRTGTNNINPDSDNVVRWYWNYETLAGYRIPSVPYRMAQELGWPLATEPRSLLNWPRGVNPYATISFKDAYQSARKQDRGFFAALRGKVLLIGATAPGLNDIKATPVDHAHPGIDVLATAIDNTKNGRFLVPLHPAWIWGLELIMLAGAARLFSRRTERATALAKYLVIIPTVLVGISLLSVSVSRLLVDLSVPAAVVFGYFSFAMIFDNNRRAFASGTGPFAATPREVGAGKLQVACLPASLPESEVHAMLMKPGCPIKLWTPQKAGLGTHWNGQGWVVWRWFAQGTGAAEDFGLRWRDVPTNASFSLAHTISAAAQNAGGPVTGVQEHG